MPVKIVGIGPVLACGTGLSALETALRDGYESKDYRVSSAGLQDYVSPRLSRRMDSLTRMAVLSAYLALEDAGIVPDESFRHGTGIVLGTALGPQGSTFSYLDGMIDDGDHCVSSFSFTNSVHNTAAAQVSFTLGIRGPARTVTAFGYTVGTALETALSWLRSGLVKRVLLILGEERSAVLDYCIGKMGGGKRIRPFSRACSYAGGEGCVTLVLEDSPGGYCRIGFVDTCLGAAEAAERAACCDMLFCAAAGKAGEFKTYRHTWWKAPLLAAYSALYGSFLTGLGAELAIAALSLRNNRVYPVPGVPEKDKKNLKLPGTAGYSIEKAAAASVAGPDRVTFVELER